MDKFAVLKMGTDEVLRLDCEHFSTIEDAQYWATEMNRDDLNLPVRRRFRRFVISMIEV